MRAEAEIARQLPLSFLSYSAIDILCGAVEKTIADQTSRILKLDSLSENSIKIESEKYLLTDFPNSYR